MENRKGDAELEALVTKVRQIAYELHVYLGNGCLEKVYENGLRHRLEKAGMKVEAQKPLNVYDLIVDGRLLIELKSVRALAGEHYAQTLNYLKITGFPCALLINFGSYKFEVRTVVPAFSSSISTPSTSLHD